MKKVKRLNIDKIPKRLNIDKIKEKTSRTSLTIGLSVFVFGIIFIAISLTALGLWILTIAGVTVDIYGELQLGLVILFMTIISLVIGFLIAFSSSHLPLKPVNDLINKMNRLAAGDFKTRLKFGNVISSHPAAKELTESFNTMATELENTEMLRNDFINSFSHEFKTPIVSITGLANLIECGNLSDEQRVKYARAIREESMRLSSMASNVLCLTKVENQTILTDVSRFNVSEQVRSAVLLLEEKWTKKNVDLQLDFDEYFIEANEELLKERGDIIGPTGEIQYPEIFVSAGVYRFDGSMFGLNEDDGFYHLYNEETGKYDGPILYAKIRKENRFVPAHTPQGSPLPYEIAFIGGYSYVCEKCGHQFSATECPKCGTAAENLGVWGIEQPGNDMLHSLSGGTEDYYSFIESYAAYVKQDTNSEGVYPVDEQRKEFLQKVAIYGSYFMDGNGIVERSAELLGFRLYSSEEDQWLFACCYYV